MQLIKKTKTSWLLQAAPRNYFHVHPWSQDSEENKKQNASLHYPPTGLSCAFPDLEKPRGKTFLNLREFVSSTSNLNKRIKTSFTAFSNQRHPSMESVLLDWRRSTHIWHMYSVHRWILKNFLKNVDILNLKKYKELEVAIWIRIAEKRATSWRSIYSSPFSTGLAPFFKPYCLFLFICCLIHIHA